MIAAPQYLILAAAGLVVACTGMLFSHRFEGWKSPLLAMAAIAGLIFFLVGLLLSVLPDFFVT